MDIKVLGCSGGVCKGHASTSLLIGDTVLLDAGTGATKLPWEDTRKIKNIVLSHSHLDHVASICFITDQDIEDLKKPIRISCLKETMRTLNAELVNGRLWPEIEKVRIKDVKMIEFDPIKPFQEFTVEGYRFTPLEVEHAVPTVGFCLHGNKHDMVFISDMISASKKTWDFILGLDRLKYFITEASFPNRLKDVAIVSKHMTPEMFIEECRNLPPKLEIYATHIKPVYFEEVIRDFVGLEINGSKIKILSDEDEFSI